MVTWTDWGGVHNGVEEVTSSKLYFEGRTNKTGRLKDGVGKERKSNWGRGNN